ncbi:hypothetical protein FQN54_001655 [Arachnomyces sp. PD_36]|nr:hypothetical protein FQN54_001655 [Arachnomyces sp. PD_36]
MPPRIPSRKLLSNPLPSHTSSSSTSSISTSSSSSSSHHPLSSSSRRTKHPQQQRTFSSTPQPNTKLRNDMFMWLNGPGAAFKTPLPGSTNYLSAYDRSGKLLRAGDEQQAQSQTQSPTSSEQGQQGEAASNNAEGGAANVADAGIPKESQRELRPFPLNPSFVSQSVLSEELRNEIYERVVWQGKSVRAVSVELGVEMRRVGAVVRLVELERRMVKENKPLALPYARAIHEMVPTTPYTKPPNPPTPHEPINDLPVHRLTEPQIFYPTSESRQFTREDAGRVFSAAPALPTDKQSKTDPSDSLHITRNPHTIEKVGKSGTEQQVLQPADVRIPHPHLIAFERDRMEKPSEFRGRAKAYAARLEAEEEALKERRKREKEIAESKILKVESEGGRWQFRFRDTVVSQERVGKDGRGTGAPGRRYGAPNLERKKGTVKIPTRVEV